MPFGIEGGIFLKELIVKNNKLIEARMKFTSNEYKFISYTLGKVNMSDRKFRTFNIPIQELNKFCFEIIGTKTYHNVKNKYALALAKKNIILKGDRGLCIYNWFTIIDTNNKGSIKVCFSPELEDFLLQNESNFTSYKLSNIINLKTFYSIRLYEILKQYEKIGKRIIEVDNLKYMFGIDENQYSIYRDFKKWVITPSIKAINISTDIKVNFDEYRINRNVKTLTFYILSSKVVIKRELYEIKKDIENVIGEKVNMNILEKTIEKHNIETEKIHYYLKNWKRFSHKSKKDPIGFFLSCVINEISIPKEQIGFNKPEQSYNFDQREYDDEFFESLYDNFKT
jgi:plasmid replication initiation protein